MYRFTLPFPLSFISAPFSSSPGTPFPRNFMTIAKTILKRLFRVYAHIYHAHFDDVIQLEEEVSLVCLADNSKVTILTACLSV